MPTSRVSSARGASIAGVGTTTAGGRGIEWRTASRRTALSERRVSTLEEALLLQLRAAKLSHPEREYRFPPNRKWRFDLGWPTPIRCRASPFQDSRSVSWRKAPIRERVSLQRLHSGAARPRQEERRAMVED